MAGVAKEREVKFRLAGLEPVRRTLVRAGAEYLGTYLQSDRYFDTADRALYRGDQGLRIRRLAALDAAGAAADVRARMTYKGPRDAGSALKSRREIETPLADADAMAEVLAACGMAHILLVEKRRSSYRLGACRVELDELPLLGWFVEIEGPGADAIKQARARLGLAGEPITEHYLRLLADRCCRVGTTCSHVTFDGCAACEDFPGR